jgi:hypothetical protein
MLLEPFEKKVEDTFASHVNAAAATSPLTGRAHQKWGRERKISRAQCPRRRRPTTPVSGRRERAGAKGMAKRRRHELAPVVEELISPMNSLDDGCLMHIFSFLSPIPGSIRS